jgi:hypothetical protein
MLKAPRVNWGTDPEGFFVNSEGNVVGSERVIPRKGFHFKGHPSVVRDGIQLELQPRPSPSIYHLAHNISNCLSQLDLELRCYPGLSYTFAQSVEVTGEEFSQLSPESRMLGCAPSENIYGLRGMDVDAERYAVRNGGGHIHMDLTGTHIYSNGRDERHRLVPLCDIFVGNTCVLLDRHVGNVERRKLYGQAGEYRLPRYGVEYRTLSNFWMHNTTLMSFVFGMASVAVSILEETLTGNDLEQELVQTVNIDNVINAIQHNDSVQAMANFETVAPFLSHYLPRRGFPLAPTTINRFLRFVNAGTNNYFTQDLSWSRYEGFSKFLSTKVK